jgi:glycogen synthase
MRVLLTTDTVGGVWTFTQELAAGLMARGHFVVLVSLGRAPSTSQSRWASQIETKFGTAFRYESSATPLEWMDNNAHAYSDAEGLLLGVIDDFRVDVVHTSQFCFGALPVDVPKVVTAHSDVFSWAEACSPAGLKESDWLRQYRALVSSGLEGADAVVTPTCWMRDALARHIPASMPARVILNGRNLAQGEGCRPRALQAVTAGRLWDEAKGLAILSDLETSFPLLVVGEAHFEGAQAPLLKTVKLLGRMDEDEVLELFRSSSLYLATSIYEPFGLAPLEAALCGCGVVARDIASLREVWGAAAEYFTDDIELDRLMLRLQDSPDEMESLRCRSTRRAGELSADRMVEAYLAQYESLLTATHEREDAAAYAG